MGRVDGKVALITGAARGQGRSHAVRLAGEGADIIAIDLCEDIATLNYPLATPSDLAETAKLVEATGQRIITQIADVRDPDGLGAAVAAGVAEFGRLDVVVANAGICTIQPWREVTPAIWDDVIGVNLTGVWNTCFATAEYLVRQRSGSMILISSNAGLKGLPFTAPYVASKHGVVGIMRMLANELGPQNVRVNTVHPTGVRTPMLDGLGRMNELIELEPSVGAIFTNSMPIEGIDPIDISEAVLFLASDESRYVTGLAMTVDAGASIR